MKECLLNICLVYINLQTRIVKNSTNLKQCRSNKKLNIFNYNKKNILKGFQ